MRTLGDQKRSITHNPSIIDIIHISNQTNHQSPVNQYELIHLPKYGNKNKKREISPTYMNTKQAHSSSSWNLLPMEAGPVSPPA
jgi:hypothetical protein